MDVLTPNPDFLEVLDDVDYGVDTCDFIRDKLAGYAGGSAIAGEMIQNADDAKASIISFHFRPDALIVHNNSHFTEQDFKNIVAIASGNKREEVEKTGIWGTGFISVFHLTDIPELESDGKRIIFEPTKRSLPRYKSAVEKETIFRLPWRLQETELSRRLEADIWHEQDILHLKEQLVVDIYRLVLFLRHVRVIEVYEGKADEKLIARIERRRVEQRRASNFTYEQWELEYKRVGVQTRADIWLYYRGQIPSSLLPAGITIKDTEITLAYPLENRDWLAQNVPGTLYNFLPTPIQTGLSFQVNGAFFPDNNRRDILLDPYTQREKSTWNQQVLTELGQLFIHVVLDIRDRVAEPRRFYELLPVSPPKRSFLEPVRQPFLQAAPNLPIVWTSLGSWERPGRVFIGRRGSRLPELAAEYVPVLPTGVPQEFRDFLEQHLKVPTLAIEHILNHLRPFLKSGQSLAEAYPMINHRENLEILYGELPVSPWLSIPDLRSLPLCLAEDETLWPFNGDVWRTDQATRRLLADTNIRFMDAKMQSQFASRFEKLVDEFRGADLVEWLARQVWPDTPVALNKVQNFIKDAKHLAALLKFIGEDRHNIDTEILSTLPLVRTEDDYLFRPADVIYRHDDQVERNNLKKLGLAFVDPLWVENNDIWAVYHLAGVKSLRPSHVIEILPETLASWQGLETTTLIEHLLELYDYFSRNIRQLSENDKGRLRRLSLCMTQEGRLVPAEGGGTTLHLSSVRDSLTDSQVRAHLGRLELDNLVHSKLISRGKSFLTNVLLLEALSPARLIETVIIPYYLDPRLDDAARRDLLHYISEQLRSMPESQQRTLFPKLLDETLVHCADGKYRPGRSVYFASSALDTVFANGYHKLHPDYGVSVAQPDDPDQALYRHSTWYWLFEYLGVNEHPTPADLVRAVKEVVAAGSPTEARVEAVRRVYELLNREVGKGSLGQDDELKQLANFAWLPARNDDAQWYHPSKLYQASLADFIGEQTPLLRFGESAIPFRRLLNMPGFPPIEIVATHLLASASQNIEVKRQVYEDLGRRWQELSYELQLRLKNEAVVWGGEKFWLARHVFLGDYREQFGQRRCYLKPPGGDAQEFLQYLGVHPTPHPWQDPVVLLEEIAGDYDENKQVGDADRQLLLRNFDHLGRQLQVADDKAQISLSRLRQHHVIPGRDNYLHKHNRVVLADQRNILDQFDPGILPVVDDSELSEAAYQFLLDLDVPRLSQIVHRHPVDTTGSKEDIKFGMHIQQLIPAFQRIALTLQETQNYSSQTDLPKERLKNVRLRVCKGLVVEYVLDDGQGWRIQGHRRPEEALYFAGDLNILYLKQKKPGEIPVIALARELERILFPNSKESVVIEQLLRLPLSQVDGYLDEHGYRRLYRDEAPVEQTEFPEEGLVDWDEFEEGPAPWEEEETIVEDITTSTEQEDFFDTLEQTEPEMSDVASFNPTGEEAENEKHPEFEAETSKETTSPPSKSETRPETAEADAIPPFTGMRRPVVPVLPNNYGELSQKFGLKRQNNEVGEADTVTSDTSWEDSRDSQTGDGIGQVRRVRFTLTFTNRYEGFLPLHHRARQMLADQPTCLICRTDFEEWTFELYVDYQEGLIYNQEKLPQFFEAYNIPAGGIVYLERVHSTVVRLYWQSVSSRIEKVRCLELLEDGTLDEYEVPAAEFPCEISEYVLRAEKRLEDPEALFKQALDKRGVFQTICEVFGEPGRELSYDEIYQGVMAQRMVAKASMDYQLNQRPCFVNVDGARWRFEPEHGSEPTQATRHRKLDGSSESSEGPQAEKTTSTSKSEDSQPSAPKIKSPYDRLIEDIRQEWEMLGNLLQLNGNEPLQQLERLGQGLLTLGQRLQADLAALAQSHPQSDDLLTMLWQKLLQAPQNQEAQHNLQEYLTEQIQQTDRFMRQIEYQLANTPYEQRSFVFPTLSRLAGQMAEQGHVTFARQLYKLLQEQGAGDFERELEQLAQSDDVHEYIQWAKSAETSEEKWQIWYAAWQEYVGFPTLRQAIQQEVQQRVASTERTINSYFGQERIQLAFETYIKLIEEITPLSDAWQTDQKSAALVWGLARQLFEALRREALQTESHIAFHQALQVAAKMPLGITWELSGSIYLEAAQSVAESFKSHSDNLAAAVLLDYAIYYVGKNHWPVDDYILSAVFEYIGSLYENLAVIHRAYDFIHQAQRKAPTEKKQRLGQRAYGLRQQRDKIDKSKERQSWQVQAEALAHNPDFIQLVNREIFEAFCRD